MSEEYEWHDTVRRSYPSYTDAKRSLEDSSTTRIMRDTTEQIMNKKLASGSVLVSGPVIKYIHIVEIISTDEQNKAGSAYIEMMTTATLTDI